MKTAFVAASVAVAAPSGGIGAGNQAAILQDGAYKVEVRLELPNLDDMGARKTATICISRHDGNGTQGLTVLSDNNPLAACPISHIRREGRELKFDIVCEGENAARAAARYVLAPDSFEARITMKMGGKNMTMTEFQRGRRFTMCDASGPPS